jgi:hypothetical protein
LVTSLTNHSRTSAARRISSSEKLDMTGFIILKTYNSFSH